MERSNRTERSNRREVDMWLAYIEVHLYWNLRWEGGWRKWAIGIDIGPLQIFAGIPFYEISLRR